MSKQEVQKLRSIFQTGNIFTVVTTAPLIFPRVSEHEEPFFNFFDTLYLDELTRAELKELVKEIATIKNDEKFLSKMKEYGQKIDAVYILTGGSPRMAMLLYDLMSKGNLVDVEKAFFKLLDENTPYYQDIFRLLSGGKRKVFDTLIELGKPATPKEIAEKARLNEKIVNSQLRRLEKDGYVRSRRIGKTAKYEVKERLFKLWRELRRQPFVIQKLSILVELLELWYNEEERRKNFLDRFESLREVLDKTMEKEASYWFLSLPKGYKKELLPQVVREIYDVGKMALVGKFTCGDEELKTEAEKAEFAILLEEKKYEEILKKVEEMIIAEKNTEAWHLKGWALGGFERYKEALEASTKSIALNPEDALAWHGKGLALRDLDRPEEALDALSKAAELESEFSLAWCSKGTTHLTISLQEFKRNNYGNAIENLNSAMGAFDSFVELSKEKEEAKEEINDDFMAFLKKLIEAKNIEAVNMALNALFEKNEEFKELFEPIHIAVEIVKSQDVSKYYGLQVEMREVVADIVKKLTGSEELVPEEYRSR